MHYLKTLSFILFSSTLFLGLSPTKSQADTTPPTVSINSPTNGDLVNGLVSISASATDSTDGGGGVVSAVVFRAYDKSLVLISSSVDTTSPYEYIWDTTGRPNEAHIIQALAVDLAGNVGSDAVYVLLNHDVTAPTVSILSPNQGDSVAGVVTIEASAIDPTQGGGGVINGVVFQVFSQFSVLVSSFVDTTAPYQYDWDTSSLPVGGYALIAHAVDAASNVGSSPVVSVVKEATPTSPTVTILSPNEGDLVGNVVTIEAQATAGTAALDRMDFNIYDDSWGLLETHTVPIVPNQNTQYDWDTFGFSNRPHYIETVAHDTSGVSVSTYVSVEVDLSYTEVVVSSTSDSETAASVFRDQVVWQVNEGGAGYKIKVKDLSSGDIQTIDPKSFYEVFPKIWKNRVIYSTPTTSDPNGDYFLILHDLETQNEVVISTTLSNGRYYSIHGDQVVWSDIRKRDGNADIFLYDISEEKEQEVVSKLTEDIYPHLFGNILVYKSNVYQDNGYLYFKDLVTQIETQITFSEFEFVSDLQISGDKIIYSETVGGFQDIYIYDITTGVETNLTNSPTIHESSPTLSGEIAAWGQDDGGDRDVVLYDLEVNRSYTISDLPSSQGTPSLNGNQLVWRDERSGNDDVYMAKIEKTIPAPEITDVTISTRAFYAYIDWKTSHYADSFVRLTENGQSSTLEFEKSTLRKDHSVFMDGLSPGTTYHYEIISKNEAGVEVSVQVLMGFVTDVEDVVDEKILYSDTDLTVKVVRYTSDRYFEFHKAGQGVVRHRVSSPNIFVGFLEGLATVDGAFILIKDWDWHPTHPDGHRIWSYDREGNQVSLWHNGEEANNSQGYFAGAENDGSVPPAISPGAWDTGLIKIESMTATPDGGVEVTYRRVYYTESGGMFPYKTYYDGDPVTVQLSAM